MEHLPLPEGVQHYVIVPYEAPQREWYDGEGFIDYPQRRGWTEEQLRGGDDTTKEDYLDPKGFRAKGNDLRDVEQFFQTWLFFGLIIDFLQMGHVEAKTEDFLVQAESDGENPDMPKMVNTAKLPQFLVRWRAGIEKQRDKSESIGAYLRVVFERCQAVLDRFCCPENKKEWPLRQTKPRPWPVRDSIATTMLALKFSLQQAAESAEVLKGMPKSPWPRSRSELLYRRLQQKWCLADVTTAFVQLDIDGHYYLAASPGLPIKELDNHSKCVPEHCMYDYDLNMYVTRHAGSPWHHSGCKTTIQYGGQLGPERGQKDWVDAISRIIDKNAIPIALWVKGLRTLWSVEYHLSGKRTPQYVAISHVWADGKGNPRANSLPECQLDRITNLVENIHWEGRKPIPENPSESDGIGFWMDTLCIPVGDKKRKKVAIASMRQVYSKAKAVLVLDDWLEQIPSTSPILAIVARLYQSNWIKRLWTHQEGFLAGLEYNPEQTTPPTSRVYIQFKDKSVLLDDLDERFRAYQEQQAARGYILQFPTVTNQYLLDLYSKLKFMMRNVTENKKWVLYAPLSDAMAQRQTARLADEILCFASILDIDVTPFLNLPDKSDAELAQDRMALFVKTLHTFDMKLIFNNYPRLERAGYSWAPRSLLNFRTADLFSVSGDDRTTTFQVVNGKRGLLVEYPGFLLQFDTGIPTFGTSERGCVIQYHRRSGQPRIDGSNFTIELPPNNVRWNASSTQFYAVILSRIPAKRGEYCPAVVGLTTSSPENGVYAFQHCSIATARVETTVPAWVDTIEAPFLDSNTKWLVY